ncbi:MAG: tetratricopeptide repeat protein [Planctomycetota bacterium]|jgi:serine/threonine protein kinase/Tfp pilus assembly protein PilF
MARKSAFGAEPEQLRELLSFGLEDSRAEAPGPTASLGAVLERPGGQIGRYKLLSVLGEGGMGIVYLAEQEGQIRRKVALKVIKPGMDSKRVIARFETERQALALLDHPNIAQVYDAGTTESGRPYFVMEHVKGSPITEYCDRHKLSIEERLILFQEVCAGLQHAHQKGIIHRDIKPSNILVSAGGDRAIPKIIDFGVAKAISQPLTEQTLFTEDSQLLGTPEYMSPEQADMASEDLDTRSDIYSLGVLLYVLLAGLLPYDSHTFRQGGIERIRKTIRETDPKTPSTRLTKLGKEAADIAQNRRIEIQTLARHLRRELEWIPLKAMRKERSERYRSASELADDIDNFLSGAPLIAAPPSNIYRIKKFARRHRALVIGLAAVLAVLIAGVVVSAIFAIGQARARFEAENARADAQFVSDFLEKDVLGAAAKARFGEATAIYMLDSASKSLDESEVEIKPLIEASIRETLGRVYADIGELEKGEQHYEHAIRLYQQHFGDEHPYTRAAWDRICWTVYEEQGRYHDMERIWAGRPGNGLAITYYYLGKYEEAASILEQILERHGDEPGGETFRAPGHVVANLARVYTAQGRYEEAEKLFDKMSTLDANPRGAGRYVAELADLYREQGRYGKAESLLDWTIEVLRRERGDGHYFTLMSMQVLVRLYIDQDRHEEAETLLNEAIPIARQRFREHYPFTLRLLNARAVLHTKQGEYDDAESLFKEALEGRRSELGDDHPETLQTINDLAILRREQGDYGKAEGWLGQALDGRKLKLGDDHPHTLQSMHELAVLYVKKDRHQQAADLLIKAAEGRLDKLGEEHPHTQESVSLLIDLYKTLDQPEEAAKWRAKLPQTGAVRE